MAKGSGIGTIIGLGVAGVGVWWAGNAFGWWGGTSSATVPTPAGSPAIVPASTPASTPAATTIPPASVSLVGAVTATINNALKGTFSINGTQMTLAVIPGGGAYNNSGQDVSGQLAGLGVTPAQLYALLSAAYTPPASSSSSSSPGRAGRGTAPHRNAPVTLSSLLAQFNGVLALFNVSPAISRPPLIVQLTSLAAQIKAAGGTVPSNPLGLSGYGMDAPMVHANAGNYVLRGARF
jgi:hypothetical protein